MGAETGIQWTDRTWNPLRGCTRVSEGCRHCYAEKLARRFAGPGQPYEGLVKQTADGPRWTNTIRLLPQKLGEPLTWQKPAMVFVNSTSDLFHPQVSDEFIAAVFGVMAACPQHTFQVLTKRPERMPAWFRWCGSQYYGPRRDWTPWDYLLPKLKAAAPVPWPLPNVWIGTSVEDQSTADERIRVLLRTPAAVRFVSYEPALGPVDFGLDRNGDALHRRIGDDLHWIIVGGESGSGARPFDVQWAEAVITQGRQAGIPVFVKQLGGWPISQFHPEDYGWHGSISTSGKGWLWHLTDRKGGEMAEWPEGLRVRQFPKITDGGYPA